ncbi:MAG TPA: hypothetical protein VF989_14125 [Polyangiaceae bacterium]|jgi:hypothetical protein
MSEPPTYEREARSEDSAGREPPGEPARRVREVRAYLAKLIVLIVIGIALMASVATWAWFRFAGGIDDTMRRAPYPGVPSVAP